MEPEVKETEIENAIEDAPVIEEETEEEKTEDASGDNPPEAPEPPNLVKHLRKLLREKDSQLRAIQKQAPPPDTTLPPKPTLEDVDFDEDKFTEKLLAWNEAKRKHEKANEAKQEQEKTLQTRWQERIEVYNKGKETLGEEAQEAEDLVKSYTTDAQQSVILKAAQNPANFVVEIARNPALLEKLSGVHDLVDLAALVARTETTMKKQPSAKPAPESVLSASSGGGKTRNLDTLAEDARKTGDYSKYFAAKRAQEAKKS